LPVGAAGGAAPRPGSGPARQPAGNAATARQPAGDQATARQPAGGRALVAYLAAGRDAVRATESGVRAGDADAVHDMRVATRRLRSTLRSHRAVLRPWQPLRDELKWLATALGDVRDGDVMARRLTDVVAAQPPELVVGPVAARIQQRLAGDTARARERLVEALDSPRYGALLDALDDLVDAGPTRRVRKSRLRRAARKALRRADRMLGRGTGSDERLHEARKAYKRARYAVEVLDPVVGKPASRLRRRLKDLQDELGAHQDAVVTAVLLREQGMRAYAAGENAFTYGLLLGRQQREAEIHRGRLPRVIRRAGTPRARGWLDG
jgi:CHAD domain-containing protein